MVKCQCKMQSIEMQEASRGCGSQTRSQRRKEKLLPGKLAMQTVQNGCFSKQRQTRGQNELEKGPFLAFLQFSLFFSIGLGLGTPSQVLTTLSKRRKRGPGSECFAGRIENCSRRLQLHFRFIDCLSASLALACPNVFSSPSKSSLIAVEKNLHKRRQQC